MVTQVTGLVLSLLICYVLEDFIWGFIRLSLINSFILGIALFSCCFLLQNLIFRMKTLLIIFISVAVILGTSVISFMILLYSEPTVFIYYTRGVTSFLLVNFLFIIAFYIISSGFIVHRENMVEKEKVIGNERVMRKQMELKLLSAKVNPHFLFNTLNMILNLLKKPETAETVILNLSDLLRHNLEHSEKNFIDLQDELDTVRKYLEIQKLRFGDKLHYEICIEDDFLIPPLIIQPLIENSIKYNINKVKKLDIYLHIFKDNHGHKIEIIDSVKAVKESMLNQGQGLTITKRRIENGNGYFTFKNGGIEISFKDD